MNHFFGSLAAFLSGCFVGAVLFFSGIGVYATYFMGTLPYSRPHIEFENDVGDECVGWYMNGGKGAIMLCEGSPPKIIIMKQSNNSNGPDVMHG